MTRSGSRLFGILAAFAVLFGACSGGTGTTSGGTAAPNAGAPVAGGTLTFALENDLINGDPMLSTAFVDRTSTT